MPRIRPAAVLIPMVQVAAVAANTVFLQANAVAAILISSYLISYTWTRNVKRLAFGTELDRHVYAASCMIGAAIGWAVARTIQHLL